MTQLPRHYDLAVAINFTGLARVRAYEPPLERGHLKVRRRSMFFAEIDNFAKHDL